MPSEDEINKTIERAKKVDSMWSEIEEKLQEFDRDKEEFEREFGFTYDKFVTFMTNQAQQARASADPEMLAKLEQQTADIRQELEDEVSQAQARHAAEQQLAKGSGAKRARRMRDMI